MQPVSLLNVIKENTQLDLDMCVLKQLACHSEPMLHVAARLHFIYVLTSQAAAAEQTEQETRTSSPQRTVQSVSLLVTLADTIDLSSKKM